MSASKHRLYFLLQRAAHSLKKYSDGLLISEVNLTTAQLAVMLIIAENGPVTQRFLAKALAQNESAVTAMVNRLLTLGYVEKSRSASDARAWELRITGAGLQALESAREPFGNVNRLLDDALGENGSASLAAELQQILAQLERE